MVMTEDIRHRLHNRLDELVGTEEATALMEAFPPTGWADVATKSDLDHLHTVLRQEISASAGELRTEMSDLRGELRTEMSDLRGELRSEMSDLRGELRSEMSSLRDDLSSEITNLRDEVRTDITNLRDEARTGLASSTADGITMEGRLRNEIADVRSDLLRDQRNLVFSFIGANTAIATLAVAVASLLI